MDGPVHEKVAFLTLLEFELKDRDLFHLRSGRPQKKFVGFPVVPVNCPHIRLGSVEVWVTRNAGTHNTRDGSSNNNNKFDYNFHYFFPLYLGHPSKRKSCVNVNHN